MNTEFALADKTLQLNRWPLNQKNRTLQAWDSADEYLLSHCFEAGLLPESGKLLIINDSFGALTCALSNKKPLSLCDSYVSHQGIKHNAEQNDLELQPHQLIDSLSDLPQDIALVLLKVPKNNGFLTDILCRIGRFMKPGTIVIGAGKTTDIHTSTLKLFEQYIGPTKTSLAKKKSRLIFATLSQAMVESPYPVHWPIEGSELTIVNHANVFSRDSLDIGARLLLQNLPKETGHQRVIDLGCGNGVIGLSILKQSPATEVVFIDESYMAVASAKDSVQLNMPEQLNQCEFQVDDCMTEQKADSADVVVCNPPFHQMQAVTDHIAWQMFKDAKRVLKSGGRMIIVGNRNLAYHVKLKRLFGNCQTLDANKKFTVICANKG